MTRRAGAGAGLTIALLTIGYDGEREPAAAADADLTPRCVAYYEGELAARAPEAARWCREGHVMTWQSQRWPTPIQLFYHCEGDPDGRAVYLQHGWPTSSFDFQALSADLATDHLVCALDTPGHGFSDKPDGYPYSLLEDGAIIQTFLEDVMHVDEVVLLAHDRGDSVGLELLHRYLSGPADFVPSRLVLLNGSIHLEQARISSFQRTLLDPDTGPGLAAGLTGTFLASALGGATYSPPLTDAEKVELASVLDFDDGTAVLHQTIQYLEERRVYEDDRWLAALSESRVPAALVWGDMDPVAVPAVADFVWDHVLAVRDAPASYWRVPCANHYVQHDRPADLAAILRAEPLPPHRETECAESRLSGSTDRLPP